MEYQDEITVSWIISGHSCRITAAAWRIIFHVFSTPAVGLVMLGILSLLLWTE